MAENLSNRCDVFLCYRNYGAETAKLFKSSLSKNPNRYTGKIWYSDQERLGNYREDIHCLIESAKYAVLFISQDFTQAFLDDEGEINRDGCVTVQEIIEIERRRQEGKITVIGINIDNYTFSDADLAVLQTVFEKAQLLVPSTVSAYRDLNTNPYYKRKTDMDVFARDLARTLRVYATPNYVPVIASCMNWLIDVPCHWGPFDQSSVTKNANTCECLLAMKLTGYDRKKQTVYKKAFQTVSDGFTGNGLKSKTLDSETVVCTALGLLLTALEKESPICSLPQSFFDNIEKNALALWNKRTQDDGWNWFCNTGTEAQGNYLATAWALFALSRYDCVAKSKEFEDYCYLIFEKEFNGKFSYYRGDEPNVVTTALLISVFYSLPDSFRERITSFYDYRSAIEYVYGEFTQAGVQVEEMTDEGGNDEMRIQAAPWKSVIIGPVLSALSLAFRHGELDRNKWFSLLNRVNSIIETDVSPLGSDKSYYHPSELKPVRNRRFTFPTAYLIWGLQAVMSLYE